MQCLMIKLSHAIMNIMGSVSKSVLLIHILSFILITFPQVAICISQEELEQSLNYEYEEEVENSLAKLISDPKAANTGLDMKSPETQETLRNLIRKRLVAKRLSEYDANSDAGAEVEIQTWDSGACLTDSNTTKFPTLNLISFKGGSESSSSKGDTRDIRINKYYGVTRDRFYIRHNGNGVLNFRLEPDSSTSQATIRAKDFKDEYVLGKGDIYFSLNNKYGAQHSLDGQAYPLELQLVHYLKSAGSLENAATKTDGIVVTSILFEVSGRHSPYIEPLSRSAISVATPTTKWKQVHGPLDLKMLFPVDMSYLTYRGPYINEPCAENALWFVFKQPLPVTYSQLKGFRELRRDNAKKCSGIFLPLLLSKEKGGDKSATSSGGKIYLNVVRREVLSGGESSMKSSQIPGFIWIAVMLCMQIFLMRI